MPQKLINLQSSSYEHPFDRETLARVKTIPLLTPAMNFVLNWAVIKWKILGMCGSNYHVTRSACGSLYKLGYDTWDTLDLEHIPELYMEQGYYINAYTTGFKENAFIVLSTGAVDRLEDKELQFVIGHESGHIKSGHVLYHILTAYLSQILGVVPGIGALINQFATPLQLALNYWNRMSEFTADRAGLLACQDLNAALSAIMKMSGLPERYYDKASVEGFMFQAREFEEKYGDTASQIMRTIEIMDEDHPWTILRAAELIKWVDSGKYDEILNGTLGKWCPDHQGYIESSFDICPICGHRF